jgi:sodium pump decarboxylase gamma subunit
MVNISIGTAGLVAALGYAVDFLGIIFLMVVIYIMGACMKNRTAKAKAPAKKENVVDLGSVNVPSGVDPKKVAAIMAAIAEHERKG